MNILNKILKSQREKAKFTQREIAKEANITQSYYSDIERGHCAPSLKVFSKLAAILDIDMNILKSHAFED